MKNSWIWERRGESEKGEDTRKRGDGAREGAWNPLGGEFSEGRAMTRLGSSAVNIGCILKWEGRKTEEGPLQEKERNSRDGVKKLADEGTSISGQSKNSVGAKKKKGLSRAPQEESLEKSGQLEKGGEKVGEASEERGGTREGGGFKHRALKSRAEREVGRGGLKGSGKRGGLWNQRLRKFLATAASSQRCRGE